MKKLLMIPICLSLLSCLDNEDGSNRSTYSSCKIISSQALFNSDREKDLSQCWNAPGDGYSTEADAKQWCSREVAGYLADAYLFGHTVEYAVESTYCPTF